MINVDVTTYFPKTRGFTATRARCLHRSPGRRDSCHRNGASLLELGIATVATDRGIGDIGAAIQEYAEKQGCSVVRDYVGHGVGREFHMPPQVPHFGTHGKGKRIVEGMVFTIEPMINIGDYHTELLDDDWTVLTADRSLSAQFEHTILATRGGAEILTARTAKLKNSEDLPWSWRP
ncbi:MAG: M24 family metallopeptidase [Polyangiales bacterium]